MRHGCLLVAWVVPLAWAGVADAQQKVTRVASKVFDIEYRANAESLPLDSVRLWYTLDKGASWQLYGLDEDRQSPISFNAPEEGLYGFYIALSNPAGASGPPPQAGTEPQHWAYVDHTLPIVQVHPPRVDPRASDGAVVSLRWTAIDNHLTSRPIRLDYRVPPDEDWQNIAANLANTGRYDWRVPEGLEGRVLVRVSVVDQGGNRVEAASPLDLAPPAEAKSKEVDAAGGDAAAVKPGELQEIDEATRLRAGKLYQQGLWHRDRGEKTLAMARLRDALRLDPTMSVALVDLAGLLYAQGEYGASADAYALLLKQSPNLRSALEGSARVSIAQRQFEQAQDFLNRLIRRDANDVEAWLNLGDVAIYRGDELQARDCYRKAATLDPEATEIIARARLRLQNIGGLRQRYDEGRETSRPDRGASQAGR